MVYVWTILDVFLMVRYVTLPFGFYVTIVMILSIILCQKDIPHFAGWLILTLYSGEYIAKIMRAYLVGFQKRFPDLFASIVVVAIEIGLAAGFLSTDMFKISLSVMTGSLLFKVVNLFVMHVHVISVHWVWRNVELAAEDNF